MPDRLLTSNNRDLRRDRIWTWSLPAWVVTLPDGSKFNVCPSAGECAPLCYARKGAYQFGNVKAAHVRNLMMVLDDLPGWERRMTEELAAERFAGAHVRVHDAGDFFSQEYLEAWLRIMRATPRATFYAYTKEVALFRRIVEPDPPANFRWVYSYGGRQDGAITEADRQADVFPDEAALEAAGFSDQGASDLLAIYGPAKAGIVANNHPGTRKRMAGRSFREMQADRHKKRGA